jgi:hypothetical protein
VTGQDELNHGGSSPGEDSTFLAGGSYGQFCRPGSSPGCSFVLHERGNNTVGQAR